jgi:predicted metal-dependent peptidase
METANIRQEYDKVKSSLTVVAPFISSLLSRVRVILTDKAGTACVTDYGVMAISPKFWSKLSWGGKAFVLAHETFHIAFRDHKRQAKRNAKAWNYVTDAVNNDMIKEFLRMPTEIQLFGVTMQKMWQALQDPLTQQKMSYEDFEKLSKEELYRILPRVKGDGSGENRCPKCKSPNIRVKKLDVDSMTAHCKCDDCGYEWDADVEMNGGGGGVPIPVEEIEGDLGGVGDLEGEVLQEGDPEIYKDGKESDGEDVDEKWKDRVARAYDVQKTIGTVPAGLKRVVDALLKPKVDWRNMLKQAFRIGFGRTVVSTWRRPSRKSSEFPGLRRYTYPTVWCLVDMSGSISDKEAEQFLSEIYSIAGDTPVSVIVWDAQVYDVIEAKSQAEVIAKVLERLRGGGGTVIKSSLETTLQRMKSRDMVVVFSDMDIFDFEEDETRSKFSEVAAKAAVAILCSTHREVDLDGWRFVKLEVG